MANKISIIVFPAKELEKVKRVFNAFLGIKPYVESSYYTGYRLDDQEVGLDPNGRAVVTYIDVDDIEVSIKTLTEAGAQVVMQTRKVNGGLLVAQVEVDGSVLGLRQESKQPSTGGTQDAVIQV